MKNLNKIFFSVFVLAMFLLQACEQEISFSSIYTSGNVKITLTPGYKFQIKDEIGAYNNFYVKNDTLFINDYDKYLTVFVPDFSLITNLITTEKSSIQTDSNYTYDFNSILTLNAKDSSTICIDLNTYNLNVNVSDNAVIIINSDTCSRVTLNETGNANYWAFGLIAKDYVINSCDYATANIYAMNSITGNITGNSKIFYRGEPFQITANVTDNAILKPDTTQKVYSSFIK